MPTVSWPILTEADYEKDEKARQVTLTEEGADRMEQRLRDAGLLKTGNLYDLQNVSLVHHVNQALRAHKIFARDVDYIVKDDKVVIIDEFTGRMMEGRRYSEGLHQALEAKEGVTIQNENQTLASITFQNYFRLFPKLAGMTGTAMTEASEFQDIYGLEVVEVPTNLDCVRIDEHDEVYRTAAEKYDAIIGLIEECKARQQPLLVGTVSIEKSELLSGLLKKKKVPHQVLNARYHEQEAYIIAEAGVPGAVTIATNMAGRGTDIQLGGNLEMRIWRETADMADPQEKQARIDSIRADVAAKKKVALDAGGLYVIGTERHESRRIDNQLRGRSGRQGDPGASRFYLSLDDDLMRIFGSERMDSMLQRLGLKEGEAIVHPWINKALEKAQQKVEARNFESRKNILKFDDVMNDQRKVIYEQRRELMVATDVSQTIAEMRQETVDHMVEQHIPANSYAEQWNAQGLHEEALRIFGLDLPVVDWAKEEGVAEQEIRERLTAAVDEEDGGEGGALGQRGHALRREEHPAAAPGPAVEGPSAEPRPSAPGHLAARPWPARPAERVQARSLRDVRRDADAGARIRDRRAVAYRGPPGPAARRAAGSPAPAPAASGPDAGIPPEPGSGTGRRRRLRSAGEGRLRQGLPQRTLPLRLGQEVQVLPRAGVAALRRLPPRLPPPDGRAPDIAVSAAVPRLKSGTC